MIFRKTLKTAFIIMLVMIPCISISAWEDHTSLTYPALENSGLEKITVTVTSLEDFITANKKELQVFLDNLEAEIRGSSAYYPPLPDNLRFSAADNKDPVRELFKALRINPDYRIRYFVKTPGGSALPGRKEINFKDIAYVYYNYPYARFYKYEPGSVIDALSVAATAADEPDYGLDIALFEESGSWYGAIYSFGTQPFGNPDISYGTQAPFHMGFYNEAGIVYLAAPDLKRSFPALRAIQFAKLAGFAFNHGDPYWGYRFTGWGLHYVQDLTMPYHAAVIPGSSAARLVLIGLLEMLGIKKPYNKALTDVTNKHFLMEMIQLERINYLLSAGKKGDPLLNALKHSSEKEPAFNEQMLRTVISRNAKEAGKAADKALEGIIKNRSLYNRIQELYETEGYDIYETAHAPGTAEFEKLQEVLIRQFKEFGKYTRSYLNYCIP